MEAKSLIHPFGKYLSSTFLVPAPWRLWDPAVNKPGSQTDCRVGRVGTSALGMGVPALGASQLLPGGDTDSLCSDLMFFPEMPETWLLLSYEFVHYFSMLAADSKC